MRFLATIATLATVAMASSGGCTAHPSDASGSSGALPSSGAVPSGVSGSGAAVPSSVAVPSGVPSSGAAVPSGVASGVPSGVPSAIPSSGAVPAHGSQPNQPVHSGPGNGNSGSSSSSSSSGSGSGSGSGVDVDVNIQLGEKIIAEASVDIHAALDLAAGFKCPAPMAYSPWTKACACPPGQSYDTTKKTCSGTALAGAWPLPKCDASGSKVALSAFCAISPVKFTKYDATHAWCQVALDTFTFCAEAEIEAEISALGLGVNLDVELDLSLTSSISATLRSTSAGLASLFIETLAEAVVIFNTKVFGLASVAVDVEASLSVGVFAQLQSVACLLGIGKCQFDCVSFSTKGCHNYIDVVGALGGRLAGFVGVTILPDVILSVSSSNVVTSLVVKDLLCASLSLNTPLISQYKYTC